MNKEKYLLMVYEAAYIYNKFLNKNDDLNYGHIKSAAERILSLYGLEKDDLERFLSDKRCNEYEKSAKSLEEKLKAKPLGFFEGLDTAQAYVYHSLNYDVSFDYGLNIAKNVNFSGKTVVDIGGSSGGLAAGIKSVYKNVSFYVYDTSYACAAGEDIKQRTGNFKDIEFVEADFFSDKLNYKKADYYILSNVLHDWNDADCETILTNILRGIKPKAEILVYEDILYERKLCPEECVMFGLRLSINVFGGRQRKPREILKLFNKSSNKEFYLHKFYNYGVHSLMIIVDKLQKWHKIYEDFRLKSRKRKEVQQAAALTEFDEELSWKDRKYVAVLRFVDYVT